MKYIIQGGRRNKLMTKEQARKVLIKAQKVGGLKELIVENFEEWDSIEKMNFFIIIEETIGKEFHVNELAALKTYDNLIEFLEGHTYENHPGADK